MLAERITESICHHAEGPHWSTTWGGLRWVDMMAGDVLRLLPGGGTSRIPTPSRVAACVRPAEGGGAVLALEKGFALEDADGAIRPLPPLWEGPIRMNEGALAPDGSFLCGSMAYDQQRGAASMWRLFPDGRTEQMFTGVTISNGLAFTEAGDRAYYVDTPSGRVDVFDWDPERGLVERRPFADLVTQEGGPDGLTLDAQGRVWVAMFGGGGVLGLDEDGTVAARVEVPARQVTACTFGGEDLSTLFITTSREGLADEEEPQAGSLFAATPGVTGSPVERVFGG